jgi:hypothetical protein
VPFVDGFAPSEPEPESDAVSLGVSTSNLGFTAFRSLNMRDIRWAIEGLTGLVDCDCGALTGALSPDDGKDGEDRRISPIDFAT